MESRTCRDTSLRERRCSNPLGVVHDPELVLLDRGCVRSDRAGPVADEAVDVRWHVREVAGVSSHSLQARAGRLTAGWTDSSDDASERMRRACERQWQRAASFGSPNTLLKSSYTRIFPSHTSLGLNKPRGADFFLSFKRFQRRFSEGI